MSTSIRFKLSLGSRVRAAAVALILLLLGGFFLVGGFEDGFPRAWGLRVVAALGAIAIAFGARFFYVALTGKASELMADVVNDLGRMHWHA